MKRSLLIKSLGNNKLLKIIDFLIENKDMDLSKKDIIELIRERELNIPVTIFSKKLGEKEV